MTLVLAKAKYGNRGGSHQLLDASDGPTSRVLDDLRFLVDRPAGNIGTEVKWSPYWGCQNVGGWWTIWRGEHDREAPRNNMVRVSATLVPIEACGSREIIQRALDTLDYQITEQDEARAAPHLRDVVSRLLQATVPVVLDPLAAPGLISAIWRSLWPSARGHLALRTVFNPDSLDALDLVPGISMVVAPPELSSRWRNKTQVQPSNLNKKLAEDWLAGRLSQTTGSLISANAPAIPASFEIIGRVDRIGTSLDAITRDEKDVGRALLILRTLDSLSAKFALSDVQSASVARVLKNIGGGKAEHVRAASLVSLSRLPDAQGFTESLSNWVVERAPSENVGDILWLLEKQGSSEHQEWWRQAIGEGFRQACSAREETWLHAIWSWWQHDPSSVKLLARFLDRGSATDKWLSRTSPTMVTEGLVAALQCVCREMQWPATFASGLGLDKPLLECVRLLLDLGVESDDAVTILCTGRQPGEIVSVAAQVSWPVLTNVAVHNTMLNPALLVGLKGDGAIALLAAHIDGGGKLPATWYSDPSLGLALNSASTGNKFALRVVQALEGSAASAVMEHSHCDELLQSGNDALLVGATEYWWTQFLQNPSTKPPPRPLVTKLKHRTLYELNGQPMALLVRLMELIPAFSEQEFEGLAFRHWFLWGPQDHQNMAAILISRKWAKVTSRFRWTQDENLKLTAWHARALLGWHEPFLGRPRLSGAPIRKDHVKTNDSGPILLLFLAASPASEDRLALDEEARDIGERVRGAKHRDAIKFETRWAVRPEDLQQCLLEISPTIVHFSGHGTGSAGLVLHSPQGDEVRLVSTDALADLFRVFREEIRLVVLNSCFSEVQATAIVNEIDFVVGMSDSVDDEAARTFAAALYRGLAFGKSVRKAFELGINELKIKGMKEDEAIPKLLVRKGVDAKSTYLVTAD